MPIRAFFTSTTYWAGKCFSYWYFTCCVIISKRYQRKINTPEGYHLDSHRFHRWLIAGEAPATLKGLDLL